MQHCLITASRRTANANGDTEAGALMFGSLYFDKVPTGCQVSNAGTDVFCVYVCVCVCVRACARARSRAITSTVSL